MAYESEDDDDAQAVNTDGATTRGSPMPKPTTTGATPTGKDDSAGEDKPGVVGGDTADFSSLLARGLQHDEGAAALRESQARGVGDGESQHRLQLYCDSVVRAFRECGQAHRDEERLQAVVDGVDYAHELCPSWLRMPEESLYSKLATHTRNLARRLDERTEMAKNIPQSLIRDIDAITVAITANVPDAMRHYDGLNAITSLRALTQTLDRARGRATSAGGNDSTLEDKAFKCRRLVEAFIKLQESDTKVMMHSKHIVGPMSDLRRQVANELTTMSHDNTTSDAQYLWSAIQGLANILAEYSSIDSLFRRCITTALQKESRTMYDNRMSHFPSGPDTMLRRVQFMPFVVIEAYAARDENTIRVVRSTLEKDMSAVMSDNTHLLKLVGATLIKGGEEAHAIDPLRRATAEQVSALVRLNLPFHRDISQREAHAMLQGAAMVNRVATQQPALKMNSTIESRLERTPVAAPAPAPVSAAKKAQIYSRKCELCGGTIAWASNEAARANSEKMHLRSKVHNEAIAVLKEKKKITKSMKKKGTAKSADLFDESRQVKAKSKSVKKKSRLDTMEEGELKLSEDAPSPMSRTVKIEANSAPQLQAVPPPPPPLQRLQAVPPPPPQQQQQYQTIPAPPPVYGESKPYAAVALQAAPRMGLHMTSSKSPRGKSNVLERLEWQPATSNIPKTPPRARERAQRFAARESPKARKSSNTPCIFFQHGNCREGTSCPFRHNSAGNTMKDEHRAPNSGDKRPRPSKVNGAAHQRPRPVKKLSALCVDFNEGYCGAGLECPFRHEMSDVHSE